MPPCDLSQVEVMNLSQEIQSLQERLERRGLNADEAAQHGGGLYRLVAAQQPAGGLLLVARELQASWIRDILAVRKTGGGSGGGGGVGLQVKLATKMLFCLF